MQKREHRRGNAMVELAMGFALLWALSSGVFQFGYSIYLYASLVNAVTDAAYLAERSDFNAFDTTTFSSRAKNMAVYGSPTGGTSPLAPNLALTNVSVTWTTDGAGVPQTITVSVVNYTAAVLFNNFLWNNKPSCTVRYAGRFIT